MDLFDCFKLRNVQICAAFLRFCAIGFRPDPINFQLPLIFYFDIYDFTLYTFLILSKFSTVQYEVKESGVSFRPITIPVPTLYNVP
jgi:hypothetical protein